MKVYIMDNEFDQNAVATIANTSPVKDDVHCRNNLTLSADDFSHLLEEQTKSTLFGAPYKNLPDVIKSQPVTNTTIFGLETCCQKKDKICRKEQKKELKENYKHSFSGTSVFQGAVCQMKFEKNRDENRIPETILHVKCSCDFPINFKPRKHVCKPVKQSMTVFRRTGCGNGVTGYTADKEEVSVACILVKEPKQTRPKRKRIIKMSE